MATAPPAPNELKGQPFESEGRSFLRAEVPRGPNRGMAFTVAQPLAGRYEILRFFASGGMGLLLEGKDRRTGARVLLKSTLRYDIAPYARVRDREGFTSQLRLPRKTLEMERRILVLLRNAGCNAIPHPNDFVFDTNPILAGPYPTEGGGRWTYDDREMLDAEPYLVMEMVNGRSLEDVLREQPGGRLSEVRSLRIAQQAADVLRTLHFPLAMKPGMTWRLIYQDLKPANLLVAALDRVTVIDLGGCQLINLDTGQKLLPGACTAGYCPPESELPYAVLTPAADVYTVGATLFHLLTGRSPVEFLPSGAAPTQARAVRLDTGLLDGLCRPETGQMIERCLAPEPEERYPDAETLIRDIEKLLRAP
ncbi:MAG: serine/threonine protein kinase [Gemmataceae bacterium]|nr:serine/threonine protein kinase [Gemmataceae bacterium]